jgi:hypothetical protein
MRNSVTDFSNELQPNMISRRVRLHRDPDVKWPMPREYDGCTGTIVLPGHAPGSYAVRVDGEVPGRRATCWAYPGEMEMLDEPLRLAAETDD